MSNTIHFLEGKGETPRLISVPKGDIYYLKAEDGYVTLMTKSGETLLSSSLIKLEPSLISNGFIRIHRNCIVPKDKIRSVSRGGSPTLKLFGLNVELEVSRRHVAAVRKYMRDA